MTFREYKLLQMRARNAVYRAVKAGRLRSLADDKTLCVDCGERPATDYDHRDYTKPLKVEPVCQICNYARGHALKPLHPGTPTGVERYWQRAS